MPTIRGTKLHCNSAISGTGNLSTPKNNKRMHPYRCTHLCSLADIKFSSFEMERTGKCRLNLAAFRQGSKGLVGKLLHNRNAISDWGEEFG